MKIKIDQVIRNRTGEPFFDMVNGEVVEISLGGHISRILDGMSVGSVGDHRKVGRLADRFDDADGEIDLSIDDIKILQDTLKAAKAIRVDLMRSIQYLLWPEDLPADEQKHIGKWYGREQMKKRSENG